MILVAGVPGSGSQKASGEWGLCGPKRLGFRV